MIRALVLLDIALMLRQLWLFKWGMLSRFFVANRLRFRFLLVYRVSIFSIGTIDALLTKDRLVAYSCYLCSLADLNGARLIYSISSIFHFICCM